MPIVRLSNLFMCSNDEHMQIEIYEKFYSEETLVDLNTARMEELAFQPVMSIIPLMGTEENPEPSFGVVIDPSTIELTPEIMQPEPPSLKDFMELLVPEAQIEIVDTFRKTDRVFHFILSGTYPEIPTIQIETASEVITMIAPVPPNGN